MFDHVKFGVSDCTQQSVLFAGLAPLGVTLVGEANRATAQSWPAAAMLLYASIKVRKNRRRCCCFRADLRWQVDAFRRQPPEKDNGAPGCSQTTTPVTTPRL